MMSPRSFLYYNAHPQQHSSQRRSVSPSKRPSSSATAAPTPPSPSARIPVHFAPVQYSTTTPSPPLPSTGLNLRKDAKDVAVTVQPIPLSDPNATIVMAKRKASHETSSLSPSSPPRTTTSVNTRPTTPTTPVQIPSKSRHTTSPTHHTRRSHAQRKADRPNNGPYPKAVPPAVAALLAVTDIPRQRRGSVKPKKSWKDQTLTLNAIIERQQVSEKELSMSLDKSPLDLLLSPPDDLDDYPMSCASDSIMGSVFSTRTISMESMPSLGGSFATDGNSSIESPYGASPQMRRRRLQQPRRSLEPVSSPFCDAEDHPLSQSEEEDSDGWDVSVLSDTPDQDDTQSELSFSDFAFPLRPLKSAFKSNLTASLKALRSAAKSISSLNLSSIPPDDFLTRSLLTIDPKVPYTDERRPPVLEEEPSAALRRYLNPTTNARIETHPATMSPTRTYTASIQMQTYKVQRYRPGSSSPSRLPYPAASPQMQATPYEAASQSSDAPNDPPIAMRQREVRENSDFIRIAVMEMAMRKRGKLDDQRPGRARWTLPPRKATTRVYVVGPDGVPARWVPLSL